MSLDQNVLVSILRFSHLRQSFLVSLFIRFSISCLTPSISCSFTTTFTTDHYKYVYVACALCVHSYHSQCLTKYSVESKDEKDEEKKLNANPRNILVNDDEEQTCTIRCKVHITPFCYWNLHKYTFFALHTPRNIKTISIFINWFWHTNTNDTQQDTYTYLVLSFHLFGIWVCRCSILLILNAMSPNVNIN